jgi:hypothetical protein
MDSTIFGHPDISSKKSLIENSKTVKRLVIKIERLTDLPYKNITRP